MLLIIGWRGEPGVHDEPQHVKQGQVTVGQLELLDVPHWVLEADSDVEQVLDAAQAKLRSSGAPVALLVRKDTFSKYKSVVKPEPLSATSREEALACLLSLADPTDLVVSTTGKTSREVFELRVQRGEAPRDFLTVGGMGHTGSLALGVALAQPARRVICLDGDGSLIMHMGSLPVIAQAAPGNLVHVLLNNAAHESVGGQATAAGAIDFAKLCSAVGYRGYAVAHDVATLRSAWQELAAKPGPVMLEVRIRTGSRDDLGRPTSTAEQNKLSFMEAVRA